MAKVLTVEVGASLIRFCEMDYRAKNPKVYKSFTILTPEDVVNDDALVVNEELVNVVRGALDANHVHTKQVVFALNSTKIASREAVIPYVKENKIADLIKTNASDIFPVDLDLYELGHIITGESVQENGSKQHKLLILAVPKTLIESYFKLSEALGLEIVAFDYSGNSIYQAVCNKCDVGVQMIISINETNSLVTVLKDQKIALQRTIAYGVNEMVENVLGSSLCEVKAYKEAVKLLCEKECLPKDIAAPKTSGTDFEETDSEELPEEVLELQKKNTYAVKSLFGGIERVIDYYNSKNSEDVIEKAYITGLGGDFVNLAACMELALDLRTISLTEADGFNFERDFKDEKFGCYLTCMGASLNPIGFMGALKDKKAIQIVPESNGLRNISVIVLVGGIILGVALLAVSSINYKMDKNENEELTARVAELEPVEQIYKDYLQQQYSHTKINALYDQTVTPNETLVAFIEEMEQKMPSNMNIQSFTSDLTTANMSLTVKSKSEAAKLIQQFRTFDSISDVSLNSITDSGAALDSQPLDTEGKVSFSISLTYRVPEEEEETADSTETETTEETVEE